MLELDVFSPRKTVRAPAPGWILDPLSEFYGWFDQPLPPVELLEGQEVPEPYRTLLVHPNDMTSTLEKFHRQPVLLNVLRREQRGDVYYRQVVLSLQEGSKPVEFGAIRMHLNVFDPLTREAILQERWPLGHVLREENILYSSRPKAFFKLVPDRLIGEVLGVSGAALLYGRRNILYDPSERPLAEVAEIVPPEGETAQAGQIP